MNALCTRELPLAEWYRLQGTELETAWPHLPLRARVLVVEDGDRIVACWALVPLVHAEGVWIDPAYRKKASVVGRLLQAMRATARTMGAKTVWTAAQSDEVRALVDHLGGFALPGTHYIVTIGDGPCQRPS